MGNTIANGANRPLNTQAGTVPDVGGAMRDWFQPMTFIQVTKEVVAFQNVETAFPTTFMGVIQPLNARKLQLKSEGQRGWTWLWLHADPVLKLDVDEVVTYLGVQTRVMARKDYELYGYVEYELVQDWTGSGPDPVGTGLITGGNAETTETDGVITGGESDSDIDGNVDGGNVDGN